MSGATTGWVLWNNFSEPSLHLTQEMEEPATDAPEAIPAEALQCARETQGHTGGEGRALRGSRGRAVRIGLLFFAMGSSRRVFGRR